MFFDRIVTGVARTALIASMASIGVPNSADAQATVRPPANTANSAGAIPTARTSATTTTPVPPGPTHTFERYAYPGECARAAEWKEREFWRNRRLDTAYFPRTGHALQPSTVAAVRACLTRFNFSSVPQRDLLGLGQAYLAADELDLADQALAKLARLVDTSSVSVKAWALQQIVSAYLDAARPRIDRADQYLARLDALGTPAAPERIMAHIAMAQQARVRDSVPLHARAAAAALKASQEITGDTQKEYAFTACQAYLEMAFHRMRQNDGQGARDIITEGRRVLVPVRPAVERCFMGSKMFAHIGQPAAPLDATQWHNVGPFGTKRPVPGKPSLIVFAQYRNSIAYEGYGVLRRLVAKYGEQGVNVTFVTRTRGWLSVNGGMVLPDSETVRIRDYFLTERNLPVTLSITVSTFRHRVDGVRSLASTVNETAYQPDMLITLPTYLVDSDGIIRMVTSLSRDNEAVIDDVLSELLQRGR